MTAARETKFMSNKEDKNKPSKPAIAPLSSDISRRFTINESISHRSNDSLQNTVRNSHPAPGNPNRDNGGGNKDSK